jgi:hypothetical protein
MDSVADSRTGADVRFGVGRVPAGGRLVNGAGDLVNGLCRILADRNGCLLWEGKSPRGREDNKGTRKFAVVVLGIGDSDST